MGALMPLDFVKPERIWLKSHPEFSEEWMQQRIIDDSTLRGLGEVELIAAEKVRPSPSRLVLLLHDEQLNRRYKVGLMLGATDALAIRCSGLAPRGFFRGLGACSQ